MTDPLPLPLHMYHCHFFLCHLDILPRHSVLVLTCCHKVSSFFLQKFLCTEEWRLQLYWNLYFRQHLLFLFLLYHYSSHQQWQQACFFLRLQMLLVIYALCSKKHKYLKIFAETQKVSMQLAYLVQAASKCSTDHIRHHPWFGYCRNGFNKKTMKRKGEKKPIILHTGKQTSGITLIPV